MVASELNDEVGMIIVTSSTDEIMMTCKQILIHSMTAVINLSSVSPCSPILCCSCLLAPIILFLVYFWYFLLFLFSPLSFSFNLFFLKFRSP